MTSYLSRVFASSVVRKLGYLAAAAGVAALTHFLR
jgi:hypothetical protein